MKGEGRGLGIHFPTFLNLNHPSQCLKKKVQWKTMRSLYLDVFFFKKMGMDGLKRMRANL